MYLGRLLLVDDDHETALFWQTALGAAGFRVDIADCLDGMKEAAKRHAYDAVILDMQLGTDSGLAGLPYLLSNCPFTKVFILTGHGSIQSAVASMENGASGYITKDMSPQDVAATIAHKLDQTTNDSPLGKAAQSVFAQNGFRGKGQAYSDLCETLDRVKDVDSTILILGESGTGKEVLARTLHGLSDRSRQKFAAINCAAIPESLLESELFGHRKGAFTDAKTDRKGIFELCSQGTLLLDEIGDMPMSLQAKLLRVLQERVVMPVGASTPVKINTRVIAATHRDLIEEIQAGRFREDLYHRLSVVPVKIPPLRHRQEDIPLLVEGFVKELNQRFNKSVAAPSQEVIRRIMAYDWPGNIRELRNAIERAIILTKDDQINIKDLFQHLHTSPTSLRREARNQSATTVDQLFDLSLTEAKAAFEKSYIDHFLKSEKGNVTEVAKRAGRYRVDIYRLIEKYGIDQNDYR